MEFSEEMRLSNHSVMQAISLLSHFFAKQRVKPKVLQLVGLVSLFIIQKHNENFEISLAQLLSAMNNIFSAHEIRTVELHILRTLDWKINYTTACELSSYLLYTAIPNYDFSKIIDRSDCFSIACYEHYLSSQYSPLVISMTSIV